MAVQDKYVSAKITTSKVLENAPLICGGQLVALVATFEVAAADDDTSVYRIANLNSNLIPLWIKINCDAITAGTDYDLGLYAPGVAGAVVDKDCFADGVNLSSALIVGSEADGMISVDIANLTKKLYEHGAHTISNRLASYDLCLTANTVGTAAGTITVRGLFVQG
jgi:hypothetical protein